MTAPLQARLLAPAQGTTDLAHVLDFAAAPADPFSPQRREILARLSRRILADPLLRADAASVALGYWLRRANVDKMAADFERRRAAAPDVVFVPAGRVFHVAPGNVDTVFVYSWALSFLCGNLDVVRVSTEQNAVLAQLLAVLAQQMAEDPALADASRIITYEHDEALSAALSQWATHRVLWGGDATVALLRTLPLSPHATERAFGSKFSYCMVASAAYLAVDDDAARKLAGGFFNDLFWFDQMACSSPHVVFWVGNDVDMTAAVTRFDRCLAAEIDRRAFHGSASNAVRRLNYAFDMACEVDLAADLDQREFLAVRLRTRAPVLDRDTCGAGLFMHRGAADVADVAALATERDQTVTHFGFPAETLRRYAALAGARGVDRVVPIGEALAFDPNWDSFDLFGDFLRRVTVR